MDEAERSRQLAESVPLRTVDYVDPIEAVAEQWLARESAKLQGSTPEAFRRVRKGPIKLSAYDEGPSPLPGSTSLVDQNSPPPPPPSLGDSVDVPPASAPELLDQTSLPLPPLSLDDSVDDRPASAPGHLPIPAVPQAVVDFLEKASLNAIGSRDNKEMRAWQILNDYLLGSLTGDHVKVELDDLGVGNEWESLRVRIMQVEPGDDAAEAELRSELDAMKPIRLSEELLENAGHHSDIDEDIESVSVSNTSSLVHDSDTTDDPEPDVLGSEQLELRQFLRDVLGGINELEDWPVFYVRCRVSILDLFLAIHYLFYDLSRLAESLQLFDVSRAIIAEVSLLLVFKVLFLQCSPVVSIFVLGQCCSRIIPLLCISGLSMGSYILDVPLSCILTTRLSPFLPLTIIC